MTLFVEADRTVGLHELSFAKFALVTSIWVDLMLSGAMDTDLMVYSMLV